MSKIMVRLENVVKDYGGQEAAAVNGLTMDINQGEFLTLLGPSGCGKTTTLRMIAGLEEPTNGKIIIDGDDVSKVPPYRRNVNTVFQNYALFPHMNVFENVAFGLKIKKVPKNEIEMKVNNILHLVKLDGYENRMPSELSGGQKQRVALARAIVNNPKVLLLDEPLSALDLKLRKEMQIELKHLQRELGITFIFVTHDQEEALTMSDRIAIMNNGNLEQIGTPDEIYEKPKTRFVANFIGETNLFKGVIFDKKESETIIDVSGDKIPVKECPFRNGEEVYISIRPERLKFKNKCENDMPHIKIKLKERIYIGSVIKTIVTTPYEKEIIVCEHVEDAYDFNKFGNTAYITWNSDCVVVLQ